MTTTPTRVASTIPAAEDSRAMCFRQGKACVHASDSPVPYCPIPSVRSDDPRPHPPTAAGPIRGREPWYSAGMALDTHTAVKTLRPRARPVREVTRELVTRSHFDTAIAQLESRLAWPLVTAGIAIAAVVVAALRFLG